MSAGPAKPGGARVSTHEYFRRLRLQLLAGMLGAFLTPLFALSLYFHFQFNYSLKESGKLHLAALAESQKNTIDLFLQERVLNVFGLFHSSEFSQAPSELQMQHYLQNLRQVSDAFIDVGLFNESGVQTGYAGPYPFLHGRDYSREAWFTALIGQERNYYISDIYLGFRNKPHFTIAVKQLIDGHPIIVRATLDPDKFYLFLRSISREKGVESYIINREGRYQVVSPDYGQPLEPSRYVPAGNEASGIEEVKMEGDSILKAYARLKEADWVLIARQPFSLAYSRMYRARRIIILAASLITVAMAGGIYWTVRRLIGRAEETAEAREDLRYQLLHASKLASVGELAAGVAHEINNPLAIIGAETGVIRDMLDPELKLDHSPAKIVAELDQIDTAVFRARGITKKLLGFARKYEPKYSPTNVNKILDDVVSDLKEREFTVSNIKLVRDYDLNLPALMLDRDQMNQVFLNLVNNAQDAVVSAGHAGGTITLSTESDGQTVRIAVADTGVGMKPEDMKKIFLPFFTTKEVGKGTGLGLPVSLSIVESFGGTIEAQSVAGAGSSFTVVLPVTGPETGGPGPGQGPESANEGKGV